MTVAAHGLHHRYYARSLGLGQSVSSLPFNLLPWGAAAAPAVSSQTPAAVPLSPTAIPSRTATPYVTTPAGTSIATAPVAGAAPAICLNQAQNSVACSDPNCTFGDCGSNSPQITVGSLCLDSSENQIDCSDPNCTFGDCVSSSSSWLTQSTIISGVPDVVVLIGGGIGAMVLLDVISPPGGRRR
jgi:hypothetical protein